jgi:tetratricopeptide (TPR) repeat protein
LSSNELRRMPKEDLVDPEKLLAIKQAILATEDTDERYLLIYDLVSRLLEERFWDKAEGFVRLMETWALEQSWFLGDIAAQMWQDGELKRADILFAEAIELSRQNGRAWQRAEGLLRIARHYVEIGDKDMAITLLLEAAEIARNGQDESLANNDAQDAFDSSGVLREVVETIASVGEIDKARVVAQSIMINARRDAAIATIEKLDAERRKAG